MEDIRPFASRPLSSGMWGAWLIVGLCASTAVVLAGWASSSLGDSQSALAARMPVVWIVAAVMGTVAYVTRLLARSAFGPRALVFTSIASLCALPAIALGAFYIAGRVIVHSSSIRTGGEFFTGIVMVFTLGVAALVSLPIAVLVAHKGVRALDAVLAWTAYAALAASLVLGLFAGARAIARPDADTYVASLPKLVELPPFRDAPSFEARSGPVRVRRSDEPLAKSCGFILEIAAEGNEPLQEIIRSGEQSACGRVAIRRDERHDLWIFTNEDGARPLPIYAIAGRGFATTNVDASRVADALAAPVGWIGEALVAGIAGIVIIAIGRRRTRGLRDLLNARAATHDGGGMIRIGDEPAFHCALAEPLPAGPVLVTSARVESSGAYRDAASPAITSVVAGTHEWVRTALASARAGAHALALLVVLLASGPLAAAAILGVR